MPSRLMRNRGPSRTVEAVKIRHQYVVAEGIAAAIQRYKASL